jgi:dolichol-phosphate mannosyltransferase
MTESRPEGQSACAVVIPTYNERENISRLIPEILAARNDVFIIVVDDASPDGTAEAARGFEDTGKVNVIERAGKMGLGGALAEGFRHAFLRGFPLILTMDADFSHSPSVIPALIEAMDGASLAIGSRYVPGGGIRNWPMRRRIISWGANTLCRVLLGVPSRDNTSNFRCYRANILKTIDMAAIPTKGYAFLLELVYRFSRKDRRFREVPIVFTDRTEGSTKISRKEILIVAGMFVRLFLQRLLGK